MGGRVMAPSGGPILIPRPCAVGDKELCRCDGRSPWVMGRACCDLKGPDKREAGGSELQVTWRQKQRTRKI